MKIILNNSSTAIGFRRALESLLHGSSGAALAVSYLQISGWDVLRTQLKSLKRSRIRIICTDQMSLTNPMAIRKALDERIKVHLFEGNNTYHPKVYLAYDHLGRPIRFLVASANLSYSAFSDSIEAGVLGSDTAVLKELGSWFEDLFRNHSSAITSTRLKAIEEKWREVALIRVKSQLGARKRVIERGGGKSVPVTPSDLEAVDDIFSSIQLPIGLLNMDYAGNNIRNLRRVRRVLSIWRRDPGSVSSKQRSEFKLLGLAAGGQLTSLGKKMLGARTDNEAARLWCVWLRRTNNEKLMKINKRLLAAKRTYSNFWRLRLEVRKFFLRNAQNSKRVSTLRTIELLCNMGEIARKFSMADLEGLESILEKKQKLPNHVREALNNYEDNKGARGWELPDRKILPVAWKQAL